MSTLPYDIETLRQSLTGEVILPGDDAYEAASTIMIAKGEPLAIVCPRTAADVAEAVQFAQAHALVLSVRNGGHSNAGHSTNTGGLVIDLRHLNTVEIIDEPNHIVRIGGGATWGQVGHELQKHGLGISSGDTSSVGVGGLTLAGGIGWMVRKYGLALDNLLAVELIIADGALVRATKEEHDDLFWAVRGGGGNFGIAISFEFTAHPIGKVYSGAIMYELANLDKLLKGWRDHMRLAPEELTTMVVVMPPNPAFAGMPAAAMVMFCYADDNEQAANNAIEPLLHLGKMLNKDIKRIDYVEVLQEAHPPKDIKVITNNVFVREFTDKAIDTIAKNNGQILQIRSVGGAMNRVDPSATAFAHRDSEVLIVSPVFIPPDAAKGEITKALAPWRKIAAFSSGAYINFFTEDTEAELKAAYPPATLARLVEVKSKYDPRNVFSQNYNIKPTGQ